MMYKKFRFLFVILSVLSFITIWSGCKKPPPLETDPTKIILGKWETIEMGNYPNMWTVENSSGYAEYLPDSVLREYSYETGEYFYKNIGLIQQSSYKVFIFPMVL